MDTEEPFKKMTVGEKTSMIPVVVVPVVSGCILLGVDLAISEMGRSHSDCSFLRKSAFLSCTKILSSADHL